MGCCGPSRHQKAVLAEQKWDYITLTDFKSTSCLTPFSYMWLWFLALISIAVYAADTFVAVNLLAFNRWSSQIQPAIPLEISKWIFVACILLSWALAAYEWQRAIRVIRRGSVAEAYLDDMAVVLQSMGIWQGNGWRRFLVFAELTKSRKGVDYIALFVYFQFQGAIRIIFAEGPRQVVNAITLYSVMQADMLPVGEHASSEGRNNFDQFWYNVELLAKENREQSIILSTMLFTLTIWVISALLLLLACILYLVFLWHYIPSSDGSLEQYNRKKADQRLELIVGKKVRKALEKEQAKQRAMERKAMKHGKPMLNAQPTLPSIDEKGPVVGLKRTDSNMTSMTSTTTLSDVPSRTGTVSSTARGPTLPGISEIPQRPPMPSRSATPGSTYSSASYNSNAPLLDNASSVGYGDPPIPRMPGAYGGPGTPGSRGPPSIYSDSPIERPGTAGSNRYAPNGMPGQPYPSRGTPGPYPPGRMYPPSRPGTSGSHRQGQSPISPYDQRSNNYPPPGGMGQSYELSAVPPMPQALAQDPRGIRRGDSLYNIDDYYSIHDAHPPMPELPAQSSWENPPASRGNQGYSPYVPDATDRSNTPSAQPNGSGYPMPGPRREFSEPRPMPSQGPVRPPMRSATGPYPAEGGPNSRFAGNPLTPVQLRDSDPDVPAPLAFRGTDMPPPRSATAPLRGPASRQPPPNMPGGPRSQTARPWEGDIV